MSIRQSLEVSEATSETSETSNTILEKLEDLSDPQEIKKESSEISGITIIDIESTTITSSYDDPKNWSPKKKLLILIIISFASMISPMANTIYYPALISIRQYFETTEFIVNISVSVYVFFTGTAPLFIGAFSDVYGNRRHLYLIAILLFVVPSIVCALVKNIWILIVMRAIQACGSSATQCLGAGVISDIYVPTERGRAYGILYLGFYIGDLGGPIIGGFITENIGFKWIFWLLASIGCALLLIIFFFLPETFRHNTISSIQPSRISLKQTLKKINPLTPIKLLRLPNVALKTIYMSSIWAFMYVQNVIIPTFYDIYQLSSLAIGLTYLAPGIGYLIGSVVGGRYSDYVLAKYESKHSGYSYPEVRLNSIWLGSILIPISYCAFGWTLQFKINLIYPIISMFLGGFGTLFVFNSTITYLVDSYPEFSASAIALSDFIPCTLATVYIIITVPIRKVIGIGWLFTILISINLISISCIILVCLKGKEWREKQNTERTQM
ncbi:major facilitator superfamily domain-containing protein [Glomus cerebriforme]|uniref:Major facilitator superfamily domain-containing protein n=1 Tax=Glomus cerebriforme TaxID=658196 RepID=A0A397TSL5_9GLOM|nr:major facilitator superfamily domain-containing protein [Glomus cerebriforme]